MTPTTAIILGAGEGRRMRPYTQAVPKCLIDVYGQPLLNYQVAVMKKSGVDRIVVVRGYGRDLFTRSDLIYRDNPDYSSTDMVWSLLCAKDCLTGPTIISYGDILYTPGVLRALLKSTGDVSVVIDTEWRSYWEMRFEDPLVDAESLKLDGRGFIVDIGRRHVGYDEIEGQYIGLVSLTERGVSQFLETCARMDTEAPGAGAALKSVQMTGVLQQMIAAGIPILGIPTKGEWIELDNPRDYDSAILQDRLFSILHALQA